MECDTRWVPDTRLGRYVLSRAQDRYAVLRYTTHPPILLDNHLTLVDLQAFIATDQSSLVLRREWEAPDA
jgi:hypothetical protein